MPAVPQPSKVLITGVNGYLGAWTTRKFLEAGYAVRGTVRSLQRSSDELKGIFASYGDAFELVQVEDIAASGAFDKAVVDVVAVIHTASLAHFRATTLDDMLFASRQCRFANLVVGMIVPAVNGTVGILQSVVEHVTSVKRAVITSSVGAIVDFTTVTAVNDETTWNDSAVQVVEEKGAGAGGRYIYAASKVLAERAAWNFVEDSKDKIEWDLVAINCPLMFGPVAQDVQTVDSLPVSYRILYDILVGKFPEPEFAYRCVDIRDVAQAHVLAAQTPAAGGERIIVLTTKGYPQDILDVVSAVVPAGYPDLPKGEPGKMRHREQVVTLSTAKMQRIFPEWKLIPLETAVKDSLEQFMVKGWLR